MTARIFVVWLALATTASAAHAQTAAGAAYAPTTAVEGTQSVGVSSEPAKGAATQLRMFGEPARGVRFVIEGSFAAKSEGGSDAFGTAYPYEGNHLMEAYAEYLLPQDRFVRSVRGGRYRTPFGIYSAGEHAYLGFTRPPLIRYGNYFGLSNGYLEHGVDVVVGRPHLSAEVSVGQPADVGSAIRWPGVDTTVRVEGSVKSLIVGGSFINTNPYLPAEFGIKGKARFGGVDGRWMKGGVQLRGEFLAGRPFDTTSTTGGYIDLLVHRPVMGPITALARAERLDYKPMPGFPEFALYTKRYQAGLRARVWQGLSVSVAASHQTGQQTQTRPTVLDVSVTYSIRKNLIRSGGD